MTNRPAPPANVKREVRQRCGFGCIICGCPIIEYHHIEDWAKTKEHAPENLTLLCRMHHGEATNSLLPKAKVVSSNKYPYCLQKKASMKHSLHYDEAQDFKVILGKCSFLLSPKTLRQGNRIRCAVVNNQPFIEIVFIEGVLFLNCEFYDKNDELILKIEENELLYSTKRWDIQFVKNTLTIHDARRKIIFEVDFKPPSELHIKRAKTSCGNMLVDVNVKGIKENFSQESPPTLAFSFKNNMKPPVRYPEAIFGYCDAGIVIGPMPADVINAGIHHS